MHAHLPCYLKRLAPLLHRLVAGKGRLLAMLECIQLTAVRAVTGGSHKCEVLQRPRLPLYQRVQIRLHPHGIF